MEEMGYSRLREQSEEEFEAAASRGKKEADIMLHSALDCHMHLFLRAHLILRNTLSIRNYCPYFTAEDMVTQGGCVLLGPSQSRV